MKTVEMNCKKIYTVQSLLDYMDEEQVYMDQEQVGTSLVEEITSV